MKVRIPEGLDAERAGIPLVKLVFCINLFTDKALSELGPAAHASFDQFRKIVGDPALRFYATGTMSKHKPVTKRALTMLATWLAPGAKLNDYSYLCFQDSAEYNHAPSALYLAAGREPFKGHRADDATIIRLSLPLDKLADDPEELVALVKTLWASVPLRSGQAGFALESTRYLLDDAHEHAYAKSMRHPGIDIPDAANDAIMVGFDRIRGVGWLTMLDDAFVAKLGGLDALTKAVGPGVDVIPLGPGVMLRAGKAPQFGDVNAKDDLPAQRAVFAACKPLMPSFNDVPSLNIGGDFSSRMEAWLGRFGP